MNRRGAKIANGRKEHNCFNDSTIALLCDLCGSAVKVKWSREIQEHLLEIYKVEVSPALISNATEAVTEEVKA